MLCLEWNISNSIETTFKWNFFLSLGFIFQRSKVTILTIYYTFQNRTSRECPASVVELFLLISDFFFFFFFFFFLVFKLFLISCNKKMQTWRNRTKDDFTSSGLRDVPWQSYSSANLVSMEFEKFLLPWRKKIYNVLQKNKKFTTKNYKKKLREFMEFYMN